MESKSEHENKREASADDDDDDKRRKAADQTAASSTSVSPRRRRGRSGALRARKAGCQSASPGGGGGEEPSGGGGGEEEPSPPPPPARTSSRVLRDRSTRSVPAWLKDTTTTNNNNKSEDEEDEAGASASKRKKVPRCRRKKKPPADCPGTGEDGSTSARDLESEEKPVSNVQGAQQPRPGVVGPPLAGQPRAPLPGRCARASRAPRLLQKQEKEDKEDEDDDVGEEDLSGEKDFLFEDSPGDTYPPQDQSEEEEEEEEEEVGDLSKAPKPKRRAPARPKERKDPGGTGGDAADIKVEGSEELAPLDEDVKMEEEPREEDPEGPRKKKPPVQYVRCEMEGCGTVLAHPRYLQHHIKYQHLLKKKYAAEAAAAPRQASHRCEICGFTCRQKASLNWHMKKHDADASYQFSCSICGKKFEKKDCVVAHKAKSHPEVLIAEALAANAGAVITTPAALLEQQGVALTLAPPPAPPQPEIIAVEVGAVPTPPVPVTIALSPADPPSPVGLYKSVGGRVGTATGFWRSLSWAYLHLMPKRQRPSLRYATHTRLPPMSAGLACMVSGTCFCSTVSLWSACALKGLAKTPLPAHAPSGGGGSLFWGNGLGAVLVLEVEVVVADVVEQMEMARSLLAGVRDASVRRRQTRWTQSQTPAGSFVSFGQ
ncbi:LOW QUALITY PROTEIN: hypothetical protein CRUP_025715 [Coryphaenoides rupestris]|nr:LOW QUALITY PROTEIN: hypothetical protein CRUP_025715 [Coryphaenoides rupestris]